MSEKEPDGWVVAHVGETVPRRSGSRSLRIWISP